MLIRTPRRRQCPGLSHAAASTRNDYRNRQRDLQLLSGRPQGWRGHDWNSQVGSQGSEKHQDARDFLLLLLSFNRAHCPSYAVYGK